MDVESEAVRFGIHLICLGGVFQLVQHFARTDAPTFVPDADVGGRVVMGLKEVGGFEVGGEVRRDELLVLTAGLGRGGSVWRVDGGG